MLRSFYREIRHALKEREGILEIYTENVKTSLCSSFIHRAKKFNIFITYYAYDALDIVNSSSMQDACFI